MRGDSLAAMLRAQAHRGPDGEGRYDKQVGGASVALGHGRLAIIDLSDAAAQPMESADGNDVLVFNGEIFNYVELREELVAKGVRFRGSSDTEVMLEALRMYGDDALRRFDGMWAMAWLDRRRNRLTLSRDRFGIKPLYVATIKHTLYFASEIKTIVAGSGTTFRVNDAVVARYIRQGLLQAQPQTFFDGIEALAAGSVAEVDLSAARPTLVARSYWSIDDEPRISGTVDDVIEQTRALFRTSVERRLRSDVPVGVLLSGGLDSSSIAAMVREVAPSADVRLISASSDDQRFDESRFVGRVAEHLHRPVGYVRLRFDADEAFRLLDRVTRANDEPVGTFSWVAHYLLMQHARELGVTVLLSGQGADEVLCGYRKYLSFYLQDLVRQGHPLRAARSLGEFVHNGTVLSQFKYGEAKRYLPRPLRLFDVDVRGERLRSIDANLDIGLGGGHVEDRQRADIYQFSVPSLVHYEDRMSMAFGREIRLPFLEHRLVSGLVRLPTELKLRNGWTKWVLRRATEYLLPHEITWRKDKQGFANPQSLWLKRELRGRIEGLLREPMLVSRLGLIDQVALAKVYRRYCEQADDDTGSVSFRDVFHPIALELWARQYAPALTDR